MPFIRDVSANYHSNKPSERCMPLNMHGTCLDLYRGPFISWTPRTAIYWSFTVYDIYFSNFGRSPVSDDLCKDSAPRHPRFWRRRILKAFTIYGHGGHLGQPTATILAIFHSPNLRRLHMKFEQNWPRGSRGEVI